MYPEKSSLSIRLTEPVVSLRGAPERPSRHHGGEMPPPAVVRGLLALTLEKPTKISSIEFELQAKATTHYTQGAGPSHTNVTEQYKVHAASTVVFKAGLVPQVRQRATPTWPTVQFRDNHAGSEARHGTRVNESGDEHWRTPSETHPVTRNASPNPQLPGARRRFSSDDPEADGGRTPQRDRVSFGPAPPYHGLPGQHFSLGANSYPSAAGRSHSVASSSRITELQSSPVLSESSRTPEIRCDSPTSSVHSVCDSALPRTSSIDEYSRDDGERFDTSAPPPGHIAYYGLSRIATGSSSRSPDQDRRGRSHSRFSFGNVVHIFDAVKDRVRSQSPRARSIEQERGRSLVKGKGKAQVSTHDVEHVLPQIRAADTSAADGANDESNSGWVMFPEGTYTYPIFFTIPNDSPPTLKADHGSLIWKVKAEVKRFGAFKSRITARKEVVVVSLPTTDDLEEIEGLDLQRQWDDQFQYHVQITGRGFPVGGKVPFQLTIMPLAKIKVHCILVYLDERTDYYTRAETQARPNAIRRTTLLVIRHNNANERHSEPILPLVSNEPDVFRKSPLYCFLMSEEDEREVASSLMGPGPWTIRHELRIPDSCSNLRPSNRTKGSNIMVNHTLRIVLRVEKEEETQVTAGKKKLYDIVIHAPIQILSCHCTSEWTSLPRYAEALRLDCASLEDTSTCPCRTRRQAKTQSRSPASKFPAVPLQCITSFPATNSSPSGGLGTYPSDSLAGCTYLHELLMCGLVSERGEAPPPYELFYA